MNLIEKHKAVIITFLLAGIVVFGMFSIQLKQHQTLITESYYALEPIPEIIEKRQYSEALRPTSTNKAFNEDQEYKDIMRNFKTLKVNDFERTTKAIENLKSANNRTEDVINDTYPTNNAYALNPSATESYKKLQDKLERGLENKEQADAHAKSRSTLTYSLKDRTLLSYNTPRYLCEKGGKIVVTIRVNTTGNVTDTSINGASNSTDQCLIDHAMAYANAVKFSTSQRHNQLGTITFIFKGKN